MNKLQKVIGLLGLVGLLGTSTAVVASERDNKELVEENGILQTQNRDLEDKISKLEINNEELLKVNQEKEGELSGALKEIQRQKLLVLERSKMADLRLKIMQENDKVIRSQKAEINKLKIELQKQKSINANAKKKPAQTTVKTTVKKDKPTKNTKVEGKTFNVSATAYTPYCKGCSGITATGINVRKNPNMKLIAVDPRVIPLGSKVYVEGYGYAIAGDTGGAIKGKKIDLLMPTTAKAKSWGRRTVKITVLK